MSANNGRYWGVAGVLGLGGLAWLYFSERGEAPPRIVARSISPEKAAQAREAYLTLQQAIRNVLRRSDLALVQYAFANGALETGWGRWSFKGPDGRTVPNINNWGSIHCKDLSKGCSAATDHEASGVAYPQDFQQYATPLEGAEDLIREMYVRRPQVLRALTIPRPTIVGASIAMRRTKYVTGWCPTATEKYGADVAKRSFAKPDESTATAACAKEAILTHAGVIAQALADFLPATRAEPALTFGEYKRDFRDYRRRENVR